MRRAFRLLLGFATLASAALCVLFVLLWGLSRISAAAVWWAPPAGGYRVAAWSASGRLVVHFGEDFVDPSFDRWGGRGAWGWQPWTSDYTGFGNTLTPEVLPFIGFAAARYTDVRSPLRNGVRIKAIQFFDATYYVAAPYAALVAAAAVVPAVRWRARRRRIQAARADLCPVCGYDWRATPGRCSECGAGWG